MVLIFSVTFVATEMLMVWFNYHHISIFIYLEWEGSRTEKQAVKALNTATSKANRRKVK